MMGLLSLRALGLAILVVSASTVYAITCNEAITILKPCQPFLVGTGPPKPSAPCCLGVQTVNRMASTTQARRELCQCFVKVAPSLGVKPDRAKQLPDLCGIKVAVPIDPKVDCSSIPLEMGLN